MNNRSISLRSLVLMIPSVGNLGKHRFGLDSPVSAKVPGRPFEKVVVIPRKAVRQLSRITVVDRDSHIITKRMVTPLWENDTDLVVSDEFPRRWHFACNCLSRLLPRMELRLRFCRTLLRRGEPPVASNGNDDKTGLMISLVRQIMASQPTC